LFDLIDILPIIFYNFTKANTPSAWYFSLLSAIILPMLPETRRLQILDRLTRTTEQAVLVTELSREFDVSEMTIRRDLDWLAERAIVTRVHGGALLYSNTVTEKPFGDRLMDFNSQKKSIGWAAAQLVNDGDRIILDAGTTTQQVARHLAGKKNLTVITNNLAVIEDLVLCSQAAGGYIETILLGGFLKQKELCTVGSLLTQELAALTADKYFLSVAGFTIQHGATDPDMREVEVKQAMLRAASQVILVADSSKYGVTRLGKIAPMKAIHKLVTDDSISEEVIAEIETAEVAVITPRRMVAQAMSNQV
jgi:DeoR/GlpR family transcriptional regulator of sugar metabolism